MVLGRYVLEITVEEPRNVVHTNLVLIRADSPEEAYQKAMGLGRGSDQSYENPDRKLITFRFRGLRDLNVIHDELGHGTELIYSEDIGMDETSIQKWVTPKDELSVFTPISPSPRPDYRSRDVVEELYERFPDLNPDDNSSSN